MHSAGTHRPARPRPSRKSCSRKRLGGGARRHAACNARSGGECARRALPRLFKGCLTTVKSRTPVPKGLLALKHSFAVTTTDTHRPAHAPGPWVMLMRDVARSSIAPHYFVVLALAMSATPALAQTPVKNALDADLGRLEVSARAQVYSTDDPTRGRIVTAIIRGPVAASALRAMGLTV